MSLPEVPALETVSAVQIQPYDIAVLIDNVVYQLMNLDGNQAAIYLSQPTFVQVEYGKVRVGQTYDPTTKTFSTPE